MNDAIYIRNRDSVEAWLKTQLPEVAVWIAARAAARVLPIWWQKILTEDWALERNLTALPALRGMLTSLTSTSMHTDAALRNGVASAERAAQTAISAAHANDASADAARIAIATHTGAHAEDAVIASYATAHAATADAAIWASITEDVAVVSTSGVISDPTLWKDRKNPLEHQWASVTEHLRDNPDWSFWLRWYQSLLDGTPMNPDMLADIALIEPEVWDAGQGEIAARIDEICELYRLRAEVVALRAERDNLIARAASATHRSHNQPPELVDDTPEVARQITVIWAGLDEAKEALEAEEPDKTRLRKIGEGMLAALTWLIGYCGRVADRAVMSAATVGGPAALDYLANNGRILQFIKDLISFGGG